jgi:RHS repeat-associated protein
MNDGSGLKYLLTDHLGSVVAVTDASGALVSQQRYLPFGGVRTNIASGPIVQTDYGYTGQRNLDHDLGLMDYKARFYSPVLNRFIQPDTIISNFYNPQTLNRFSYVNNRPINFNDPTGHIPACTADGECNNKISNNTAVARLKVHIKFKYGIKMSEEADYYNSSPKSWNLSNLRIMIQALSKIDSALNGNLKKLAGGATFKWGNYDNAPCGSGGSYCGYTYGTTVSFYNIGQANINTQNIYHEFGHILDNSPGLLNAFSRADGINNADYLDDAGRLDRNALINRRDEMIQHEATVFTDVPDDMLRAQNEHWADMFANYVAGNINLDSPEGRAMNTYVQGALCTHIGTQCPP